MMDTTDSSVTDEMDSYLLDKSCELSSINHYPQYSVTLMLLDLKLPSFNTIGPNT